MDITAREGQEVMMMEAEDRRMQIIRAVASELDRATLKFGAFNNPHEGYAVILEELDELWDEIKHGPKNRTYEEYTAAITEEAIQVAAMAVRFVHDCCRAELDKE